MKVIVIIIAVLVFVLTTPASATLILIDSYNETHQNATIGLDNTGEGSGQAFTNSGTHSLNQASFYLKHYGAAGSTYDFKAKLYNCTGTVGTNAHPTGAALAESNTLNDSDLTTSHVQINFTFTPYTLINGYDYCIVVELTSYTQGFLVVGVNTPTPTHAGNEAHNISAGWVGSSSYDCIFWIYELETTPTPTNLTHTKGNTWCNHTWDPGIGGYGIDSYNFTINGSWNNGSANEYYNHTGLSIDDWSNITVWGYNSSNDELSVSSVSENVQVGIAPHITAYYPTDASGNEVGDSQLFNVTTDDPTNCTWYINGSQVQYNTSNTLHTYVNSSLDGGHWNFTAVVNNTNGSAIQTWIFEVGADSVDRIVLSEDRTNLTCNIRWEITRIGSNVTHWNVSWSATDNGSTYYFRYDNDTYIGINQTATSDNETLWFNSSTLLPEGIYYISKTEAAVNTSTIIIPANSYGMINNWTVETTFSGIATNESNDVCYTYYNVTTGEWDSHYPPYSWNSNYVIPLEASVMMFVDAETTVTATIVTPSSTELYVGWNMLFVEGTDNETIADITADIGANCTHVYYFDSTAGAYSNTSLDTVQPCQGILPYITQNFTWVRSDL